MGPTATAGVRKVLFGLTGLSASRTVLGAVAALLATRLLGPHDRGLMVLGMTLSGVAALFVGMGTGSVLRSRLPGAVGEPYRLQVVAFSWWSTLCAPAAGLLAAGLSLLSAPLIDPGLASPTFLVALVVATAGQVALVQLPDAWYAAGLFGAGSGWSLVVVAAGLVGMFAGTVFGSAAWILLLWQGAGMLLAAVAQVVRMRAVGMFDLARPTWQALRELPRIGVRAFGLSFGLVIALRMDRYVVGAVSGPSAVAVYSLAATLASVAGLVPVAVGQIAFRDSAAGRGLDWARRSCRLAARGALAVSVPVALGGWLLIEPLFGVAFAPSRPLLLALLVAGVAYAPFEVASRALMGAGWIGTAGVLGAGGAVAAIACYCLAVPAWGLAGAGLGCIVLYASLTASSWFLLRWRLEPATHP